MCNHLVGRLFTSILGRVSAMLTLKSRLIDTDRSCKTKVFKHYDQLHGPRRVTKGQGEPVSNTETSTVLKEWKDIKAG